MAAPLPLAITFLGDVVFRGAKNRLAETSEPGMPGAEAALDTFYHALNNRSLEVCRQIWLQDPLAQLDNPVGGIMRGTEQIDQLYKSLFEGPVKVQAELYDIVVYSTADLVVFAGRERAGYERDNSRHDLDIRTTRVFLFAPQQGGWRHVHHHGSVDDPDTLARYQQAVRG